jgi:hypothetical protein
MRVEYPRREALHVVSDGTQQLEKSVASFIKSDGGYARVPQSRGELARIHYNAADTAGPNAMLLPSECEDQCLGPSPEITGSKVDNAAREAAHGVVTC